MNIIFETETLRTDVGFDGRFWLRGSDWRKDWHFDARGRSLYLSTPFGYVDLRGDIWRADPDQPNHGRPARTMLTIEHGWVKGVKDRD